MPDTNDLIGLAIDKNPIEFANAFDEIIRQKAADAIESKRIELAQSIYGVEDDGIEADEDDIDEDEVDFDEDDLDIDTDDEDLDDDLDLDDFDLDDIDIDIDLEDLGDTDDQDA